MPMFYDLFGALTSLLSTYYFIRLDCKAWAIGLLATCVNGWLYWQKGIYADMCLEIIYFLSICYGWYRWSRPARPEHHNLLTYMTLKQWRYLGIAGLALYMVIFSLLITFSNSTVAKLDALTTSLSLTAQWLMCHKVIVTWVLWFIADAMYALMYLQKDLPAHTLLMIIYTGMAVMGYLSWRSGSQVSRLSHISKA